MVNRIITIDSISNTSNIQEHKDIINSIVKTAFKGYLRAYNHDWPIKYQKEFLCTLHEQINKSLKDIADVIRYTNKLIKSKIASDIVEQKGMANVKLNWKKVNNGKNPK